MAKYQSVDEYMSTLTEGRRQAMDELRSAITETAPEGTESIAYNMPAVRLNGKFLVSYEAYKHHYSLFPWTDAMAEELGDELKPYIHGRGTLRFPADEPIPVELVKRIVRIRLRELTAEPDAAP